MRCHGIIVLRSYYKDSNQLEKWDPNYISISFSLVSLFNTVQYCNTRIMKPAAHRARTVERKERRRASRGGGRGPGSAASLRCCTIAACP